MGVFKLLRNIMTLIGFSLFVIWILDRLGYVTAIEYNVDIWEIVRILAGGL